MTLCPKCGGGLIRKRLPDGTLEKRCALCGSVLGQLERKRTLPLKFLNALFLKRLWLYFRLGHTIYLAFALSFVNFALIFYRLLVEYVPFLQAIFHSLWIFFVSFLILYLPVSIIFGYWHKKTQWQVETAIVTEENPYSYRLVPKERVLYTTLYTLCRSQKIDASKLRDFLIENGIKVEGEQ